MPKSRLFVAVVIWALCVPVIDPSRGRAVAAVVTAVAALVAATHAGRADD